MSETSLYQIIDEEELSIAEQISVTTELIRIIEKDIDEEKSKNAREGWSTWAIIGGIAGAALLLLGQTKDIQQVPSETAKISAVSLLLFFLLLGIYYMLSGSPYFVKAGRLISADEAFKGRKLLIVLRLLLYLAISITIFLSDFNFWIKLFGIILILFPSIFFLFSIIAATYTKLPLGNNPQKPKTAPTFAYVGLSFYLIAVILLGSQLPFPVGQNLSSAYMIGVSISVIIALVETLLSTANISHGITELSDLRDDIIFQRVGLNEALNRYKILKEGKTLFEEMKPDIDKILSNLYQQEEIYNNQYSIVEKSIQLIPVEGDSEAIAQEKIKEINLLEKSFVISLEKLQSLSGAIQKELEPFHKKLKRATNVTGDLETEKIINDMLNRRFQDLVNKENKLHAMQADFRQSIEEMNKQINKKQENQKQLKSNLRDKE